MVVEQEKMQATPSPGKPPSVGPEKRLLNKRWDLLVIFVFLLLVIAAEAAIIVVQSQANKRIEAQSEQALGKFLKSGAVPSGAMGTDLLMQNVRFCWSKQICINTNRLAAKVVPVTEKAEVNFDHLTGFMVQVNHATVQISPQTLQGMFNESVFNYPGSNLRDLRVTTAQAGGATHVKLGGALKYLFLWVPFEMDTNLAVDRKTNTLVIAVNDLEVFGLIPATWLIEFKPFNLEKLLTLPPNKHLIVRQNLMMVKPFGLFPPPRVNGTISNITVTPKRISLSFSGPVKPFQPMPDASAKNFIYLEGGSTRFGRLGMINSQIQVVDQNPANLFQFSLLNYQDYLPKSTVQLQPNGSVKVTMADHGNLSEPALKPQPPAPTPDRVIKDKLETGKEKVNTAKGKVENFVDKAKEKTKDVLGL